MLKTILARYGLYFGTSFDLHSVHTEEIERDWNKTNSVGFDTQDGI